MHLFNAGDVICENLIELCLGYGDLASAMMCSKSESYRRLKRILNNPTRREISIDLKSRRAFSVMKHRLIKEGFILKNEKNISLTKKGVAYCRKMSEKIPTPLTKGDYTLIVFDIPQHISQKREWLRREIESFGFMMLQKSVWIGNVILPKKFLEDLRDLKLISYVHIFSVQKTGTLGSKLNESE